MIKAALELVTREGVAGLTLRGAARRAGVSQAAPYRHFADKQALLAAVAEEGFRAMTAAMRAAAAPHGADPLRRFHALGAAYVRFARDHPSQFRVMFGPEVAERSAHPGLAQAAGETFSLLVEAIQACQRARLVRDDPAAELAISAWSVVHGVSALLVDGQLAHLVSDPAVPESIVTRDILLGLAPR
jgi:AcrR family transcriptional regulator